MLVRPGVVVRPAQPADLPALADLCLAARTESAVGAQLCSGDPERLRHQLGTLIAAPGGRVLVGVLDGTVCGLLLARLIGPSVFADEASLTIEAVYVAEQARRRGVGHAMLSGVVEVAEHGGATEVFAAPLPGARGMQRFLARLGFAPAAAHRVASTAALQRRLVAEQPGAVRAGRGGGRGLEDLIARRRRVRAAGRAAAEVADLRVGPERTVASADQARRRSLSRQVSRAVQIRPTPGSSSTIS
ncbi:N-acetyltransferase family protein [Cellulomonas hominis]